MKSQKKKVRQIFSTSTFPIYVLYIRIYLIKKIDISTNSTACYILFNIWSDVHVTHVMQVLVYPFSPQCHVYICEQSV